MSACRSSHLSNFSTRVPQNYYRITGEVRNPGLQPCRSSDETLLGLISEAGGLTDYAYTKKILVINFGITNAFDLKLIRNETIEDPVVSCGSTVEVQRIAPF